MRGKGIDFGAGNVVVIPREKLRSGTELYIAGPQGFAEATRPFHFNIKRLIERMGGTPVDPWLLTPLEKIQSVQALPLGQAAVEAWDRLNFEIGENNHQAIVRSNGILANLDGTDVDSGTAAEIAAGCLLGKPVLGYRGDFRLTRDNIGGNVNLQVEYYIKRSGGRICTAITRLPEELLRIWG